MMLTSALPCDSPAVKNLNTRASFYLKKLPHPGRQSLDRPRDRCGPSSCTFDVSIGTGGRDATRGGSICVRR